LAYDVRFIIVSWRQSCGQSLATNALKHLIDQLDERTDQLKNASKRLQHHVDPKFTTIFVKKA